MFLVFLFCCCLAALGKGVLGVEELHIKNASELIQLSNNVSSGTSYSGTTVFLDVDIDFSGGLSEQFEPIGNNANNYYFQAHLMDKATQSAAYNEFFFRGCWE